MGRPEERLDRDGSPIREFAWWLRDLRNSSGLTYDQLGRATHFATSTVQAATAGNRLPTLRVTMAFVGACGGDAKLWRSYWTQIRRQLDSRAPAGVGGSVSPPWADGLLPTSPQRPAEAGGVTLAGPGAGGWFMESFSAVLNMGTEPVEALERRRIVATADGLGELVTSITVPRHPEEGDQEHGLDSELIYGGSLEARQQPYDSYFQHVIVLPRPLRSGERHEYAMRLRVPRGQRMNPHYVHIPYRRSDHFELRVRFAPARIPGAIWVVRDAPTAVVYRAEPGGERLTPDRFGEVYVSFREMRPGLGYGVCWREPDVDRISPGF